jgi:hypothetical protein
MTEYPPLPPEGPGRGLSGRGSRRRTSNLGTPTMEANQARMVEGHDVRKTFSPLRTHLRGQLHQLIGERRSDVEFLQSPIPIRSKSLSYFHPWGSIFRESFTDQAEAVDALLATKRRHLPLGRPPAVGHELHAEGKSVPPARSDTRLPGHVRHHFVSLDCQQPPPPWLSGEEAWELGIRIHHSTTYRSAYDPRAPRGSASAMPSSGPRHL